MKNSRDKKIRLRGFAEANAVGFEAGIDAEVTTVGDIGKIAIVKEDGSVICKDYDFEKNVPEISKKIHKRARIFRVVTVILSIVCLVGYFMNAIYSSGENYLGFSMAYIFFGLSFVSQGAVVGLGKFLGDREMEGFSKFSGAKNAVINFFYTHNKIPTIDEVKETSRILDRADYVENASTASILIILGICRLLPGVGYLLAAMVFLIVMVKLEPGSFRRFWQYIATTSKPEEIHCKAAIRALEDAMKWTENVSMRVSKRKITREDFIQKMGHIFEEQKCSNCKSYKYCKNLWENISDVEVCEVEMIREDKEE